MRTKPIKITGCARCGGTHKIIFKPFTRPANSYTHFAICPVMLEPILMKYTTPKKRKN